METYKFTEENSGAIYTIEAKSKEEAESILAKRLRAELDQEELPTELDQEELPTELDQEEPPNPAAEVVGAAARPLIGTIKLGSEVINAPFNKKIIEDSVINNIIDGVAEATGAAFSVDIGALPSQDGMFAQPLVPEQQVLRGQNNLSSKRIKPEEFLTEDRAIKSPETLIGAAATAVPYAVGSGLAYKGFEKVLKKSISRFPRLFQEITKGSLALTVTENLLYTGNPEGESFSGFVKDLDEQEAIQLSQNTKDFVDFLSINEDDTVLEERVKLSIEALMVTGGINTFLKGAGLSATAIKNLTTSEKVVEYLKSARKELNISGKNSYQPVVSKLIGKETAKSVDMPGIVPRVLPEETAEGLAQIEKQRQGKFLNLVEKLSPGLSSWLKYTTASEKWFTSRGYFTPVTFNLFRESQYATRQLIKEAENLAQRLQNNLNEVANKTKKGELISVPTLKRGTKKYTAEQLELRTNQVLKTKYKFKEGATLEQKAKQMGLPVEIAEVILESRKLIDDLSKKLANSKIVDEEMKQVILGNSGRYLNQAYRLFEDNNFKPGDVSTSYVVRQLTAIKEKGGMSSKEAFEEATVEVKELVEQLGDRRTNFFETWQSLTPESKKILLKKKKLNPKLKEFLGVIENPSENVILTVSKLGRLLNNNKFNSDIYKIAKGKYIFDTKRTGYSTRINIPGSVLNGKYTTPEFKEAVEGRQDDLVKFFSEDGKGSMSSLFAGFGLVKGATQKAQTVYSTGTQARNLYGAAEVAVSTGIPPCQLRRGAKILANNFSKASDPELNEIYEELIGFGIVNTEIRAGEYRSLLRAFSKIDAHQLNKNTVLETSRKFLNKAEDVYVAGDDFFKINAYFYELDVLKKAYPNESLSVLKTKAAQKIRDGIPNYDLIPPNIKNIRYSLLGNFPAFTTEIIRTSYNNIKIASEELTSGNARMAARGAQRLSAFITVPLAYEVFSEASEKLVGFTEEKAEAAKALTQPPWSTASRIYNMGENGDIEYIDLAFIDARNSLKEPVRRFYNEIISGELKGKELNEVLIPAITESVKVLASPYAEEAMISAAVSDVFYASMGNGRTRKGRLMFPKEMPMSERIMIGTSHILETFVPATLKHIYKAGEVELQSPIERQMEPFAYQRTTPEKQLKKLVGISEQVFRPDQALYHKAKLYDDDKTNITSPIPKYGTGSEKALEKFEKELETEYLLQQDLAIAVQQAKEFSSDAEISQILKKANLSGNLIAALLDNRAYYHSYALDNKFDIVKKYNFRGKTTEYQDYMITLLSLQQAFLNTSLLKLTDEDQVGFDKDDLERDRTINTTETPRLELLKKSFEREAAARRASEAKGGEVYNVPRVPVEPDERIDKMTGLPYNEQAGEAFIDEEERIELVAGGAAIAKNLAKLFGKEAEEVRNVMPAPQRFFNPEDKDFKPFLGDMGEQPGGRYLEMGAEGPTDITGEFPEKALIGVTPQGKPVMQVSRDLLEGETRTDGRKIKTNLFKKKAGWKWTQVPEGFDPEPPSNFPLVSVEDGKQHYYTLQTEFPEGVELTRYEKSKSEPRLRPTKKGNVHLGNKVGEISVRGKKHPVYDKIEIYGLVGASTAGMLEDEDRDEIMAGGLTRRFAVAKGGKINKKKMACNKPKRTPKHPKKSHVVKACKNGKEKIIRFGEQGAKTAGKPKAGESKRMKAKRKSFKARHGRNIRKGNMSAAYWADKVKW